MAEELSNSIQAHSRSSNFLEATHRKSEIEFFSLLAEVVTTASIEMMCSHNFFF